MPGAERPSAPCACIARSRISAAWAGTAALAIDSAVARLGWLAIARTSARIDSTAIRAPPTRSIHRSLSASERPRTSRDRSLPVIISSARSAVPTRRMLCSIRAGPRTRCAAASPPPASPRRSPRASVKTMSGWPPRYASEYPSTSWRLVSATPGPSRRTSTSEYRSAGRASGSVSASTTRISQSGASAPVHHDLTPVTRTVPSAARSPRVSSDRGSDEATPGSVMQ